LITASAARHNDSQNAVLRVFTALSSRQLPAANNRTFIMNSLLQRSVHCRLNVTNRSVRHAAHHLSNKLPPQLVVFFISLVHHHHPALIHRQALIMDRLLTFLVASSTLVVSLLSLLFSKSFPPIAIYAFLGLIS